MAGTYLLAYDLGTGGLKAALYSEGGAQIDTLFEEYPVRSLQETWAEQDPERVWTAVIQVLRDVVTRAGANWRILALALAAQSGSLIPAGTDGVAVYPMITWLDGRTDSLIKQWQVDGVEETVRHLSGWGLHSGGRDACTGLDRGGCLAAGGASFLALLRNPIDAHATGGARLARGQRPQ